MFVVFAHDVYTQPHFGRGDTPEEAWQDLVDGGVDEEEIERIEWFRAEPVEVTRKTVFTVEG